MSTHPYAADVLADQLDVYMLKQIEEERRLRLLRQYRPDTGKGTAMLENAIERAENALAEAKTIVADIRGAIEKLRTP